MIRRILQICEEAQKDEEFRKEANRQFDLIWPFVLEHLSDPDGEQEHEIKGEVITPDYMPGYDSNVYVSLFPKPHTTYKFVFYRMSDRPPMSSSFERFVSTDGENTFTFYSVKIVIPLDTMRSISPKRLLNLHVNEAETKARSIFVHEYVHYMDSKRIKGKPSKNHQTKHVFKNQGFSDYVNTPAEYNAWFQQFIHGLETQWDQLVEKNSNLLKAYPEFRNIVLKQILLPGYRGEIQHPYEDLTPENRRRFDKRLYQFFRTKQAETE